MFLPPNVDECLGPDACGTNAFARLPLAVDCGTSNQTIYALAIDPVIEVGAISEGADPQGNPDAEVTVDIAAHETNEAMTDPEGVGWMDPNGYEVADKCEFGPQHGNTLGFADKRVAVRPGDQPPQVPHAGDLVQRRRHL